MYPLCASSLCICSVCILASSLVIVGIKQDS